MPNGATSSDDTSKGRKEGRGGESLYLTACGHTKPLSVSVGYNRRMGLVGGWGCDWLVGCGYGGRDATCTTESYLYEMESSSIIVKYSAYLQFNIMVGRNLYTYI